MTDNGPTGGSWAPVAVAAVWGVLVAPKSAVELADAVKLILGLLILEACAVALAAAGAAPPRVDLWHSEWR